MKHLEEDIQMACVRWFGYQYPQYALLLHHSPNGGFRNAREAARFKAMGTRAGVSDLILFLPRKGYHGLCIEMKTDKGTQSKAQKEWQAKVEAQGYKYVVCRSIDEFVSIMDYYVTA